MAVFCIGFVSFLLLGPDGADGPTATDGLLSSATPDRVDRSDPTAVPADESQAPDDASPIVPAAGSAASDGSAVSSETVVPSSTSTSAPDTVFEPLRNAQPKFSQFATVPSAQLDIGALTEAAERPDNGTVGDGQFRLACEYSHFSYDDPIVFPGEPGRSHLHMFFGNTDVDAFTTDSSLRDSGGGTCNGFELNRSGYWTPALIDGDGNAVVPDRIILYYKTKQPQAVQAMPQGLKMVAGNTHGETFTADQLLAWACGENGNHYGPTNRIPDCGGDVINASIVFPNCWDGVNLDSTDHLGHMAYVDENHSCPASHPVRLPQISILLYFPGTESIDGWHLSSDLRSGFNTGPGATLHADWWGGWNDEAIELWTDGCMRRARNCSFGQTATDRQFASLNGLESYEGPNFLPLPPGSYPRP